MGRSDDMVPVSEIGMWGRSGWGCSGVGDGVDGFREQAGGILAYPERKVNSMAVYNLAVRNHTDGIED